MRGEGSVRQSLRTWGTGLAWSLPELRIHRVPGCGALPTIPASQGHLTKCLTFGLNRFSSHVCFV